MKTVLLFLAITGIVTMSASAQQPSEEGKQYPSPDRFEESIQAFEKEDAQQAPPPSAVVCIGSSSMKGWHGTIEEDLAPLTVIPRGFGGSNMNDALYFVDRVVIPYKPRAVVLYEGDNDVAQGITPEKIAETFRAFAGKIHIALPEARIYVLSIKPSISRWHLWPAMQRANDLLKEDCAKDERLTYIDIASGMLGEDGTPLKEIFKDDNLHMKREGYIIWRDAVRPVLVEHEKRFECEK